MFFSHWAQAGVNPHTFHVRFKGKFMYLSCWSDRFSAQQRVSQPGACREERERLKALLRYSFALSRAGHISFNSDMGNMQVKP